MRAEVATTHGPNDGCYSSGCRLDVYAKAYDDSTETRSYEEDISIRYDLSCLTYVWYSGTEQYTMTHRPGSSSSSVVYLTINRAPSYSQEASTIMFCFRTVVLLLLSISISEACYGKKYCIQSACGCENDSGVCKNECSGSGRSSSPSAYGIPISPADFWLRVHLGFDVCCPNADFPHVKCGGCV